jgi:hypothetical protein
MQPGAALLLTLRGGHGGMPIGLRPMAGSYDVPTMDPRTRPPPLLRSRTNRLAPKQFSGMAAERNAAYGPIIALRASTRMSGPLQQIAHRLAVPRSTAGGVDAARIQGIGNLLQRRSTFAAKASAASLPAAA